MSPTRRRHTARTDVRVGGGAACRGPHSQPALRKGADWRSAAGRSRQGAPTTAGSLLSCGVRSSLPPTHPQEPDVDGVETRNVVWQLGLPRLRYK